jgi:hypothetical protein
MNEVRNINIKTYVNVTYKLQQYGKDIYKSVERRIKINREKIQHLIKSVFM